MSEWWTYRPSDFLMFAPGTYWRLFELHNLAAWPLQIPIALAVLAWGWWAWRGGRLALRAGFAALALAWAAVAGGFLLRRYAPVNWAASAFALGFAVQAAALAAAAFGGGVVRAPRGPRLHAGLVLGAWALVGQPWLAVFAGRPWTQAELFGLAPDPTVIATLGLLLCCAVPGRGGGPTRWLRAALWVPALAWCAVSAATLWTLGSAQGWVMCLAGLAAMFAAGAQRALNRTRSAPAP